MRQLLIRNSTRSFFSLTYTATLFLSFHYFFITYINSTVISGFVGEKNIGVLYTFGSFITVILFLYIAKILKHWGNYKTMLFFLGIECSALLGLAFSKNVPVIILSFMLQQATYPILIVSLDIFLEHYTRSDGIGKVRGTFLALMNSAAVVAPLIVGLILGNGHFSYVYIISTVFIIALFLLVYTNFKNFRDDGYGNAKGINIVSVYLNNQSIRQVFMTSLMLQLFYAWMIVYVPLYLSRNLGFSWPEVGLAISISLLPFVLFEIPLGKIADQRIGEKEILVIGFLIMITAATLMGESTSHSLLVWIGLLTLARTGASFVEVASDTYFFKKIDRESGDLISFWRITHPLGSIFGTIAGSVSLILLPFQYIFFVLAAILVIGLAYSIKLKDTL